MKRLVEVQKGELRALALSFAYFFLVLCSYYILRPIREEIGVSRLENLPWLFTGTFVAMAVAVPVFSALASKLAPRRLVPWVYRFFGVNLLLFFFLLRAPDTRGFGAMAFFIWLSVFNLFVVSIFWSVMADVFRREQARRLFGFIAAGGTTGAMVGPALTALLAPHVPAAHLLFLSMVLLELAVWCVMGLARWRRSQTPTNAEDQARMEQAVGGGFLEGLVRVARSPMLLAICAYVFLLSTTNTFLYFEQAEIVRAAKLSRGESTALFAKIDLFVNVLTLGIQTLVTGPLLKRLGVLFGISLLPLLSAAGFLVLGWTPIVPVLVLFQGLRRAAQYAIERPSRELLFTVVPREDKYKSKNFIDTFVFRGGDALSGWGFDGLKGLGLGMSAMAFLAVPLSFIWLGLGIFLGRQDRLRERRDRGEE